MEGGRRVRSLLPLSEKLVEADEVVRVFIESSEVGFSRIGIGFCLGAELPFVECQGVIEVRVK